MTDDEQKELIKDLFEERSAVLEYDGGLSRKEAEAKAREETKIAIFRCLVRLMIRWAKDGRRNDVIRWLDKADAKGGRDPKERKIYADAINQQIKLGNDGSAGMWKE